MKLFPVHSTDCLNCKLVPRYIPWEVISPYEEQAQKNHSQSLKRLAERGGLGIQEMYHVMTGQKLYPLVTFDIAFPFVLNAVAKYLFEVGRGVYQ